MHIASFEDRNLVLYLEYITVAREPPPQKKNLISFYSLMQPLE
jgi:hypothetical protein